jgi:hypothetical protein
MPVRPQIIVLTYHKTGTVLFHSIMASVAAHFGLTFGQYFGRVERVDPALDVVLLAHSLVGPRFAARPFRAIRVVRDPRDIWVSSYLYHRRCSEAWCTNTNFDPSPPITFPQVDYSFQHHPESWKQRYLARLGNKSYQQNLLERDRSAGLAFELEGYSGQTFEAIRSWRLGAGRTLLRAETTDQTIQTSSHVQPGLSAGGLPATTPPSPGQAVDSLLLVQLEALRADFDAALTTIFSHLGFSDRTCTAAVEIAQRHDLARMSDAQVAQNKHIHSRDPTRWRSFLSTAQVKSFEERHADIILSLGYHLEHNETEEDCTEGFPPSLPAEITMGASLADPSNARRHRAVRLIYCDPALRTYSGHSFTFGKHYQDGFHTLGQPTVTLAHREVDTSIGAAMNAHGAFRLCPSSRTSVDPLCGPTKSYLDVSQAIYEDLAAVEGIGRDDRFVFDASSPAAVNGLTRWMHFRGASCPRVVVMLHNAAGVTGRRLADGKVEAVPIGPEPALYRLAGLSIPATIIPRLAFATTYACYAAIYAELLGHPVQQTPHPVAVVAEPVKRAGKCPVVIGFIGAQQPRKGFGIVPAVVQQLLRAALPVKVLVQDSFAAMQEPLTTLTALAATDDRLTVQAGPVDRQGWQAILDRCDLLVAPYDQQFFRVNGSGIVTDAIANGIPIVVPTETTLAALLHQHGCAPATFASPTVEGVTQAIEQAVAHHERLSHAALRGRESWARTNGPLAAARGVLDCFHKLG